VLRPDDDNDEGELLLDVFGTGGDGEMNPLVAVSEELIGLFGEGV